VEKLRGKVCKKIIRAASKDNEWEMQRFQFINRFLAELDSFL
jgi:hypothetical protein